MTKILKMQIGSFVTIWSLLQGFLGDEEIIPQFLCDILKPEFQLPDSFEPINILVLGYADTNREEALSTERYNKMRKELSETVSFESL